MAWVVFVKCPLYEYETSCPDAPLRVSSSLALCIVTYLLYARILSPTQINLSSPATLICPRQLRI